MGNYGITVYICKHNYISQLIHHYFPNFNCPINWNSEFGIPNSEFRNNSEFEFGIPIPELFEFRIPEFRNSVLLETPEILTETKDTT